MKKALTLLLYIIGLIILLILYPFYNDEKDNFQIIPFLIFWLTTVSIVISLIQSVYSFIKNNNISGTLHIFVGLTIYIIYLKLLFIEYNTFFHAFLIIVFLIWSLIRHNSEYRTAFSIVLIANLATILLSNHFLLTYFNSTKIAWSESGVNWDDYKDSFSNHKNETYYTSNLNEFDQANIRAITSNAIKYKINTNSSIPSVVVGAYFSPEESYFKAEYKTTKQLNHEKRYIDICEYHVRLIRKEFYMKAAWNAEIFVKAMIAKKEKMNEQYMLETNFGQDEIAQQKWDDKISRLLSSLEDYK